MAERRETWGTVARRFREARRAGHGPVEHFWLTRRLSGSARRAANATRHAYFTRKPC